MIILIPFKGTYDGAVSKTLKNKVKISKILHHVNKVK